MNRILFYFYNPKQLLLSIMYKTACVWPDETYLKVLYWLKLGCKLNLENPTKYTEKCQWLKLYHHNPIYTEMVDKYEAKKYVADRIGKEHVVSFYGVWDSFDEIDFSKLPNSFCLKCTHDSGSFVICKDKNSFDVEAARKKLERGLKQNFYLRFREWPYKNVKPRIIAEEFLPTIGNIDSTEYKVTCCNGKVKFITVCGGVPHSDYELRSNDHFTKDWERLEWYAFYKPKGGIIEKPKQMDEIVELCERLSQNIPYVRIDWYIINGVPFFGEFTFYTWAGFPVFTPKSFDETLGSWIELPNKD